MSTSFRPFPRDFHRYLVVDTETANSQRDSLCALAALRYEDGREVGRFVTLVNPKTPLWTNTHLHGISQKDVANALTIDQVEPVLRTLFEGTEVQFAHWAPFDSSVIDRIIHAAGLPPLRTNWRCTCKLARTAFPSLPDHRLPTVAASIGAALRHHEAASDAETCAAIVRKLYGLPQESGSPSRSPTGSEVTVTMSRDQLVELVNSAVLTADAAIMEDDDPETWRFVQLSTEAVAACVKACPSVRSQILCTKELDSLRLRLATRSSGGPVRRRARSTRRAA